jgi:Tfp pilus assembly protein PilF
MTAKKIFTGLVAVFMLFVFSFNGYALDWQRIYARSSRITIDTALDMLRKDQRSVEALALLGFAYLDQNEPQKAQVAFNTILRIDPQIFEARWGLAEVMLRAGDLSGGEKELTAILSKHPDFMPAQISEASLKFYRQDYQAVLSLTYTILSKGIDQVGHDAYLRAYLLQAAARGMTADQNDETVKYIFAEMVLPRLNSSQGFVPKSAPIYLGLGTFFLTTPAYAGGDLDKAAAYLQEAVSLNPKLADGYARLAQFYAAKGSRKNFDRFLNKALSLDSGNKVALAAKAKVAHFTLETVK